MILFGFNCFSLDLMGFNGILLGFNRISWYVFWIFIGFHGILFGFNRISWYFTGFWNIS
jgi:hypothetical protein